MKLLLDTCALSELRNDSGYKKSILAILAPVEDAAVFVSAITLGEIIKGIELLPKGRKRQELAVWLNGLYQGFIERVLPIDFEVARIWGELSARAQRSGIVIPAADGLIAATALYYGLHVVTRNTKHFKASGIIVLDPWSS